MILTRHDLIELCDSFLDDKIDKSKIQDFSLKAIIGDEFDWQEDDIISEIIFEWYNEDIYFEINKVNVSIWKNRLLTGKGVLLDHNFWNSHIDNQKAICKKSNSIWKPINKKLRI